MDGKDRIIAELRELVVQQAAQLEQQAKRIAELELQLAKALKNSSNSSKSPSSDIVKPPKKQAKRRKKAKRGGQKGHERKLREPLPPERVDVTIDYEIEDDEVERLKLTLTGEFETIQQIELPETPVVVTEHRFPLYESPEGDVYYPYAPEVHGQPIFGPRLLATIGWMKSRAHSSYTAIETYCDDVLGFSVSRGYLAKLCNGVISDSLAGAHEELKLAIPEQPQLGSDETSLKNNGKKHWIWCITASLFTLFHIASSRSRSVLEELVGEDFKGFIHFDYFSANCSFAWNFDIKAQYCWAHLIRDMRFLLKHPDKKTKAWAEQLLDRAKKMFSAWHRRDEMTESGFRRSMLTHRDRFLEIVRKPPDSTEAGNLAARFALIPFQAEGSDEIESYDMSQDYFRFMFESGVEPTNNHSEQQIRLCVIDRKITQGTRSAAGQRYHERMWTAIATCGKQNRSFFHFLHESIEAELNRQPAPSLLLN
jgi:hypothetical protein